MIELSSQGPDAFRAGVAGDTFNTAVYLSRAVDEAPVSVSYVTALGTDTFSVRIVSAMRSHGLATSHIERRLDRMPGLYAIDTDTAGERTFSYWRSASAARTLFAEPCKVPLSSLNAFDLVVISGITMAILPPATRRAILDWASGFTESGGTLAYDSNHRPSLWEDAATAREINVAMWARADIALPSVDDEIALFGDLDRMAVLDRLRQTSGGRGYLKCGTDGPIEIATGRPLRDLPPPARVVDSTAAGDSFNGGFLGAVILGDDDEAAARSGHALAAHVVGHRGAIVPPAV